MTEWQRIRRINAPQVTQSDPSGDRVTYQFSLSASAPGEWKRYFEHPNGISQTISHAPPRVSGQIVTLQTRAATLAEEMHRMDQRVTHANDRYEAEVLVPREVAAEQQRAEAEAAEARRAQLQLEADTLQPPPEQ